MSLIKRIIKRCLRRYINPVNVINVNVLKLSKSELLSGKYVVITGGSSGIGLAIAHSMLDAGAIVLIIGRNQGRLNRAVSELKKEKNQDRVFSMQYDVTEDSSFFIKRILDVIPQIDIFVNNAGIMGGVFGYTTESEFDNVVKTNLRAPFILAQEISKYFISNKIQGRMLNVLSSSSIRPANSAYMASKWGMRGLTQGMAKQLIRHGIIVNGIAPGPTATPMLMEENQTNYYHPSSPIHRYILPEEIANMAVILTSDLGSAIVGEVVYMTGGCGSITYDDVNYNIL